MNMEYHSIYNIIKMEAFIMNKSLTKNLIFDALGAFSGTISLIFSIIIFSMDTGYFESSKMYGGEAYTGIQNAAAQTANNAQALCKLLQMGFGALLLIIGLVLIIVFLKNIITMFNIVPIEPNETIHQNTPPSTQIQGTDSAPDTGLQEAKITEEPIEENL